MRQPAPNVTRRKSSSLAAGETILAGEETRLAVLIAGLQIVGRATASSP
jgi:hypothetical protein